MTIQNLKLRAPVNFPASVQGTGGITVVKSAGSYVVKPDFTQLSTIAPLNVSNPSLKQLWMFDSSTGVYNVLTLTDLNDATHKLTSATSIAVGTGSKTFTDVQLSRDFPVASSVLITSNAAPTTNYMVGQVTAYTNASLTVNVTLAVGSGTHTDWTIIPSGPFQTGALLAASNLSDLGNAATARTNLGLGGAATLSVGTTAGTVAAGNDSRITGAAQKASNLSDVASPAIARNNLGRFATVAEATAATIPSSFATIDLAGYTTAGDAGGGMWTRNSSVPAHTAYFQSADAAYWTPSLRNISFPVEIFGGSAGGSGFDNTAALNKYNSFITSVGQQRLVFGNSVYYFNTAPTSFTTAPYMTGTGTNATVLMKNYNAGSGDGFLLFTGASGVVIKDMEIGANTGTVNGFMLYFNATASNGSSGSRIDNVTIVSFGTDNYERGIYVDGHSKTTGAIGSRDHNWSNLTVFGASASSVVLSGAEGLSWSGGGLYPAGGTGAFSGSVQITGTAGVPTNNLYMAVVAVNNIDFDRANNCIVRASSIAGAVTNTGNTNNSSVGGPVTGSKAVLWVNGNYTVN